MVWRLVTLSLCIITTPLSAPSLPPLKVLWAFFKTNKALLSAKIKSTASTSSTTVFKTSSDAQKDLGEGNVKGFLSNPSTWIAGGAATGSSMITNFLMRTTYCAQLVEKIPQPKYHRLKGLPEFTLSIAAGMVTFNMMYHPARAVQEELEKLEGSKNEE